MTIARSIVACRCRNGDTSIDSLELLKENRTPGLLWSTPADCDYVDLVSDGLLDCFIEAIPSVGCKVDSNQGLGNNRGNDIEIQDDLITRSRGIGWIVRRYKDSNRAHVRRSRNPELLEVGKEIFLPARSGQWSGQLRLPLGSCRAGQSELESMEWYVFLSSVSLDFTSSPKVVSF